jgi:hypothetical protein
MFDSMWNNCIQRVAIFEFVIFFLFLICSCLLINLGTQSRLSLSWENWGTITSILAAITISLSIILLTVEILHITQEKLSYLTDPWNYADWFSMASIIYHSAVLLHPLNDHVWGNIERQVMSISLLYLWLKMLEYAGAFSRTSTVARLFLIMGKTLFQYLIILLMFVLAFGHSMYLVGVDDPDFGNPGITVIRMYRGLMGEDLPYSSIAGASGSILGPILYFLFTLSGILLLLNLLIALMASVFSTVTENIKTAFYINRGTFIAKKLEVYILSWPLKLLFAPNNGEKSPWNSFIKQTLFPKSKEEPFKSVISVERVVDVSQSADLQIYQLKVIIENLKSKMEYSFGGLETTNNSSSQILSKVEARVLLGHCMENYNHRNKKVQSYYLRSCTYKVDKTSCCCCFDYS